jgi:2'-hydroxyisoflavone reductase
VRLLVLGGTVFLSRAVAEEAVRRGHDVTCACRGSAPLPEGVRHLPLDRSTQDLAELGVSPGAYDAVVDVARLPSWVRSAVEFSRASLPEAHWVFVSTISVYADDSVPHGSPETLPLLDPVEQDVDLATSPEAYGGMKVACERAVQDGIGSAAVVRPGLIVGPGDPSGRFTYWPVRLVEAGRTGRVIAPGTPEDPVQVIDVRDLAAWLVRCADNRTTGVLDGVGPVTTWGSFLTDISAGIWAAGADAGPELVWVPSDRLLELEVEPWAGPGSLPVWLPPDHAGTLTHDPGPAAAAGLVTRPLAETARDTLTWFRATPDVRVSGLSRAEEVSLLARVDR